MNSSPKPAAVSQVPGLAEHLFRHEAGKLVSVLTGIFGIDRLQLAEDVVQEALGRALQTWPYYGIPDKPAAWLLQTAKHLALDTIRREKLFREKQPQIEAFIAHLPSDEGAAVSAAFDDEIKDRRLQLMFTCCHPQIPAEAQTALALKTLCGFSVEEIANAFLTTEAAVAKRLTRAQQKIRELNIPFEMPAGPEVASRLDGVLQIIYLLFNEGYKATRGESLCREELCAEAIRLAAALAEHSLTDRPRTHALLALMLLDTARAASRVDARGRMVRLKEQDRSSWDRPMIARGLFHLAKSAAGEDLSKYHLQAGIAACHCTAADEGSTDWRRILAHYDRWMQIDNSPVVALNHAVALSKVKGPAAGIEALEPIRNGRDLESYHLLHAVLGEFEWQLHRYEAAAEHFKRALQLTALKSEQIFILDRLRECR